jgi:NAD(P)-dependent dehydrogenase (short-subunit alcohol dehydrogenase family)
LLAPNRLVIPPGDRPLSNNWKNMTHKHGIGRTLITGGASGMGKAAASLLLADGGSVVLLGRQRNKLEAARTALGHPGRTAIEVLDITDRAALQDFVARIPADFEGLNGLVNGAGVFLPKPFLEHGPEDYDQYLELNRGTFFLTQRLPR